MKIPQKILGQSNILAINISIQFIRGGKDRIKITTNDTGHPRIKATTSDLIPESQFQVSGIRSINRGTNPTHNLDLNSIDRLKEPLKYTFPSKRALFQPTIMPPAEPNAGIKENWFNRAPPIERQMDGSIVLNLDSCRQQMSA